MRGDPDRERGLGRVGVPNVAKQLRDDGVLFDVVVLPESDPVVTDNGWELIADDCVAACAAIGIVACGAAPQLHEGPLRSDGAGGEADRSPRSSISEGLASDGP